MKKLGDFSEKISEAEKLGNKPKHLGYKFLKVAESYFWFKSEKFI